MIDALSPVTTATTATTRAARDAAQDKPSDYETFLRMLTVQMQNQDPLNPIDSADYAVQLATFSGVEQQTRTNQLIEDLIGRYALTGLTDLAGSVGQMALSAGPVWYDGTTAPEISAELANGADRGVLVVRNLSGQVVAREDVAAGAVSWSGTDITGAPLQRGVYSLSLESYAGDTQLSTQPVGTYGRVDEVRRDGDAVTLVLQGGIRLPAADLLALRRA